MNTLLPNSLQQVFGSWSAIEPVLAELSKTGSGTDSVFPAEIEGLQGALYGFFTAACTVKNESALLHAVQYNATGRYAQGEHQAPSSASLDQVLIVPSEKDAADTATDLQSALGDTAEILQLPWWGLVPYRAAAPGSAVFGERSGVLAKMALPQRKITAQTKPRIFIVTQRSLQTPVPPPDYVRSLVFSLYKGEKIDPSELAEKLAGMGYLRVPKVSVHGEFTIRGEVLDIFMPGEKTPVRMVFDFDEIGQIKTFNVETQSTIAPVDSVLVYPMKEVIWTDGLVSKLDSILSEIDKNGISTDTSLESAAGTTLSEARLSFTEKGREAKEKLLAELSVNKESEGEELFYPVLWDKLYSVLDYISQDATVFFFDYDRLDNAQESFDREYGGMYRRARLEFPVLPPSSMLIPFRTIVPVHKRRILYRTLHTEAESKTNENDTPSKTVAEGVCQTESVSLHKYHFDCDASRSFFGNINYLKEQLGSLQSDGWRIFIYADNENQSLRIGEILREYTAAPETNTESVKSAAKKGKLYFPVSLIPQAISAGFGIPECKVLVIQENEIFGRRKHVPKSLHKAKSEAIDTFVDLNPGDYVVHVNYGIGIFRGIQRVKAMGNERDYIKLEYDDEEVAFVPIEQVNLIQRYIGNEGEAPHLDRIGSKSWENRKNKVKKSVEDLAQKLIDLYSRRKASRGFPFPKDTEWQTTFEAAFPYEDTPDQITVTQEIKADMEKPVPMDRLICGDVGYGKTELAMRAAFKAVMGGKQVAFLAPTTILAEQHYDTCIERFASFPIKIAQMSRFIAPAEQKKILSKVAAGEIDILIGTHRIIQKDVIFKDLGLVIIDEEQRFGVKDKEKLKTLKTNIDSLAMSATPIPRTLHMSLLKIRDMSLLTTPPQNRQPIETVIDAYDDNRVAQAIRREVERGGQVFYLHNRVETLDDTRRKLEQLVPEMLIDVANGQMSSEELDDIFRRFKMGGFHVLVATTIIENGIDIPNVNTIIIDRADMYGVSQLYQLRGRVGRSDRKAYAYLFYPEGKALSEVAMKRLQVISDFTELGSGFKIAMKDMEIRGAGNLLGRDQSGDVYAVGFDLYLRLLNEAVQRLTEQNYQETNEVLMEFEYTGFIPDTYVTNPQIKMEIYKKIAAVQTKDELERVYSELTDRFGPIPDEVSSLLSLAEIRIIARKLYISSLKENNGIVQIEFCKVSNISVDKVLRLIRESPGRVKLDPAKPNMLLLSTGKIGLKEKSEFIREKLESLS
jgi:transcription-repair coupling factor (superfamily II helicase)